MCKTYGGFYGCVVDRGMYGKRGWLYGLCGQNICVKPMGSL